MSDSLEQRAQSLIEDYDRDWNARGARPNRELYQRIADALRAERAAALRDLLVPLRTLHNDHCATHDEAKGLLKAIQYVELILKEQTHAG